MKRALFSLLALTLAFVFACQPAQNVNVNRNANANGNVSSTAGEGTQLATQKTDKIVQIFISDDPRNPGHYIIEEPATVNVHKLKNQKIVWCIVYDGSTTPPTNVIIDNFQFPKISPARINPFGNGSVTDNTFKISAADFDCKQKSKPAKEDAELGQYRFRITAYVIAEDRGRLDPEVIISD
ncbi:MAG: hypothetical protein AABN33_22080 [Acidobacteriota bacterium]